MVGCWLSQTQAALSLGISVNTFINRYKPNMRVKQAGKKTLYFVSKKSMSAKHKKMFEDKFIDLDEDAEAVEDILGDVTKIDHGDLAEFPDINTSSPQDELKAAQLENLKMRTKVLNEKLGARKEELWSEWNEAFFNEFTEAFTKFKNDLIGMHLSEEQITILNSRLDSALISMQDRLNSMFNDFVNDEEEIAE